MSKLLRLPLTLLAVLAALFFLPGIAWGDPADCATDPVPATCTQSGGGTAAGGATEQPGNAPTGGQQNAGGTADQPNGNPGGLVIPSFQLPAAPAGPAVGLNDVPPPPDLCTTFPQAPLCAGENPPTVPLTCDGLAQLLGQTGGCPSSFSCQDLADLLNITCPAGPPTCATLAELFHLQGCPQPPTSCQEFADLLGVDNCSQIPCMDTSQLPAQARDGLRPLLDGLRNIGIKECPAKPVPTTPGKGTYMPPTQPAAQQQQPPYYANCDDARAKGKAPVYSTDPGYRPELDSDHDGIGCEVDAQPVAAVQQPTGRLAYTGTDLAPQLKVAWTLLMLGTGLLIVGRRRA
jgi:hypothetical protein